MKNIKNIIGMLAALVLSGLPYGCSKDYLAPKPLSFFSPENTLINESGFNSALASCAENIRNEYYTDGAPIITELVFSEVSVEGTTDKFGPQINLNALITPDANLNSADFNRIGWYWERLWIGVRLANTVLSRIQNPALDIKEDAKNAIIGKALFYRSYNYYRLVHQFGDVPTIMTELTAPKLDFKTVKREVILARLKKDLETAVASVPFVTNKGDVNKGAVLHLLTKVNLALGLFDDAIATATQAINSGTFKLMTSRFGSDAGMADKNVTWDLHRPLNKAAATNTEVLMLVTDRFGDPGAVTVNNVATGTQLMRQAVPFYTGPIVTPAGEPGMSPNQVEIDLCTLFGRGIGRARSTPYFTKGIWDDVKDQRHDTTSGNWMTMENLVYNNPALKGKSPWYGKRLQFKDATGKVLVSTGDTIRTWYDWPHYKLFIPDQIRLPFQGGNSDWYVFRLAETYLLRAEAYWWKGDLANAAADVNAIRTRAGCSAYTSSQVDISTILDERARELYWEEPRKTELTRVAYIFAKTGKSYNGKSYNVADFSTSNFFYDRIMDKNTFYKNNIKTVRGDPYTMSPYHVLWPIPRPAILANSLGQINQNKGYSGSETNQPALDVVEE